MSTLTEIDDTPAQMIVFDREARLPFWLRLRVAQGVDVVDLTATSLAAAVREADRQGFRPTHWFVVGGQCASLIPSGIVRA